ncbi:hypothetical protein [Chromobacterium amazonense]|uniref:hypothetical protein n=1 Tax=Chromobacterium amazonense TaxID=1382803 RepID=UPI003F7A399A
MAETAAPSSQRQALMQSLLSGNCAIISGRIRSAEKRGEYVYSIVALPAPDQFTSPGLVEVRSPKRIGDKEQDIRILVKCGGYFGNPYRYTDKDTGEQVSRRAFNNSYTFIEAIE